MEEQEVNAEVSADYVIDVLLSKRKDLLTRLDGLESAVGKTNEEYSLKLKELQEQKKPLEESLYHVEALLNLNGHKCDSGDVAKEHGVVNGSPLGASITDAAFSLLEEMRQPTHYKDIAGTLKERNVNIPGKDPAATLLSRISRDSRFKRAKGRGMYALSNWRLRTPRKRLKRKRGGK